MQEIAEMFSQYKNNTLKWIDSLKKLKQLEDEGKIVLYAGTYSFEEALRHFDSDVADFYFYTLPDRQGYHFFTNAFGSEAAIMIDNEIFAYKHRRLYNERHLTNRYFGEKDFRSGEYFNRKKQR